MKILCLHGVAGNARMFEAQTSQITNVLKQFGHEFVFVDGIMECDQPGEVPDGKSPAHETYSSAINHSPSQPSINPNPTQPNHLLF
jgi:hypothetical protein